MRTGRERGAEIGVISTEKPMSASWAATLPRRHGVADSGFFDEQVLKAACGMAKRNR
ncbi:hypothetical protein [Paraburkholderia piptadeniae]|uniref:hypothetical protein n=1 Tax=Paraburkholderia piptadeniae TaxID=1701573 RepID=UPI001357BB57|nr:hypothetical protein [Paraburkholderia piptadeniae]